MKTILSLCAVAAFALSMAACAGDCKTCEKPAAKEKCPAACGCGHCGTPECTCKH